MPPAWLADTITTELLLGDHWLREQSEARRLDSTAANDASWDGLYADNGSSFDIIGVPGAAQNVHVISTSPLAVSDGHAFVNARLSSVCLRALSGRRKSFQLPALYSVITVHAFTVRHSLYGPPSQKLQLVLDDVDYKHRSEDRPAPSNDSQPILSCDGVVDALKRLRTTREALEWGKRAINTPEIMAGQPTYDDDGDGSMLESQVPFGTQAPSCANLSRPRSPGGASFDGAKQATHVPRTASPSRVRQIQTEGDLLSLLHFRRGSTVPTAIPPASPFPGQMSPNGNGSRRKRPISSGEPTARKAHHGMSEGPGKDDTRVGDTEDIGHDRMSMSMDNSDIFSISANWLSDYNLTIASRPVESEQRANLAWAIPPPGDRSHWSRIPVRILKTLQATRKIHNDPTGIEDMHYQADDPVRYDSDQEVASGRSSAGDAEDVHEEVPSSRSLADHADGVDEGVGEPATSVMSCSRSPSPELLKPPGGNENGLPPDSSLPAASAESNTQTYAQLNPAPTATIEESPSEQHEHDQVLLCGHKKDEPDSDDDMEIGVPHALGDDAETLEIVSTAPGSAGFKPAIQVKETPISKQTGQSIVPPRHQASSGASKNTNSPSVIFGTYNEPGSSGDPQITCPRVESATAVAKPSTVQQLRELSSDVDLVMEDVESSAFDLEGYLDPLRQRQAFGRVDGGYADTTASALHTLQMSPGHADNEDVLLPPSSPPTASAGKSGHALLSHSEARLAPEMPGSKRKSRRSPRKMSSRTTKRREIPLVSYDDRPGVQGGNPAFWRQEWKELLTRSDTARRHNSESIDTSRTGSSCASPVIADALRSPAKVTEGGGNDQPRSEDAAPSYHPSIEDLQHTAADIQTPSPKSFHSRSRVDAAQSPPMPAADIHSRQAEAADKSTSVETQHKQTHPVAGDNGEVQSVNPQDRAYEDIEVATMRPEAPQDLIPVIPRVQALETLHKDDIRAPVADEPIVQRPTPERKQSPARSPFQDPNTGLRHEQTVFDRFKAVYPEYTGDRDHFLGQCRQIQQLELEDKMVPRFQWDDYIIRNRSDYKDYAIHCLQTGVDPEPYHRFYKDRVATILHSKGIVTNTATLQMAIDEFGGKSNPPRRPLAPKPPRRSFPPRQGNAPGTPPTRLNQRPVQQKPRQSLPNSSRQPPSLPFSAQERPRRSDTTDPSANSRSARTTPFPPQKPTAKRPSAFGYDGANDASSSTTKESTGNKFRDFVKGQQKMAAHTGQTSVSRSPSLNSKPAPVRRAKSTGNPG